MEWPAIRVLHVSNTDNLGGAGRAAYKIHTGLRRLGLSSRMLVKTKVTDDPDVDLVHGDRPGLRALDLVGRELVDRLGLQYLFYPSSFALTKHPWFREATIVQLYNTHGGFFSHCALPRLSASRPVVWRLSDMWPFTGHCSYSYDCERWKSGCGRCPNLAEYPALPYDTTALLWRLKRRAYRRARPAVVTTNGWMTELVAASPLLRESPHFQIPNGVDTSVFRPLPKAAAREVLGLNARTPVVLFVGHVAKLGTRKGGELAVQAMEMLAAAEARPLTLVVVGDGAESWPDGAGYNSVRIGYTTSDRLLAILYAAADVLLHPALGENLPNTVLESMACGTPAAAFDSGGVRDVVRHRATGYLARRGDVSDLVAGLRELLDARGAVAATSERCRAVVEAEYTTEIQARRYVDVYADLLGRVEAGDGALG